MYRLDLSDPRLVLPVPLYKVKDRFVLRDQLERENLWEKIESIAAFVFDRPGEKLAAVYEVDGGLQLKPARADQRAIFYAPLIDDTSNSPLMQNFPPERPIVRVYRNPQNGLALDFRARPTGR